MVYKSRTINPFLAGAILLALLAGWTILWQLCFFRPLYQSARPITLGVGAQRLKVEIASKPWELYRGLSGRKNLCADCGLLFVFPDKQPRTFVMRDMNFPLDIIFIADGRIVDIAANLPPEGKQPQNFYSANQPVDQVLEVNGGYCEKYGISAGAAVSFSN
jgi:uncharacterized membrane protein (UPF0127 family)